MAMTELEKLDAGLPYDFMDPEVDGRKLHALSRVCNFLWAARSRLIDVGGDSVTK